MASSSESTATAGEREDGGAGQGAGLERLELEKEARCLGARIAARARPPVTPLSRTAAGLEPSDLERWRRGLGLWRALRLPLVGPARDARTLRELGRLAYRVGDAEALQAVVDVARGYAEGGREGARRALRPWKGRGAVRGDEDELAERVARLVRRYRAGRVMSWAAVGRALEAVRAGAAELEALDDPGQGGR